MVVKIFSYENALQIHEDILLIRIKSKNSSFLIMEDYLPIIGEIDGDISFADNKNENSLKDVRGYYVHRKNTFELILKNAY
ncbi:MAG: hypothetical protein ACRCZK_00770 [Oscillospiraceae bacterium]